MNIIFTNNVCVVSIVSTQTEKIYPNNNTHCVTNHAHHKHFEKKSFCRERQRKTEKDRETFQDEQEELKRWMMKGYLEQYKEILDHFLINDMIYVWKGQKAVRVCKNDNGNQSKRNSSKYTTHTDPRKKRI